MPLFISAMNSAIKRQEASSTSVSGAMKRALESLTCKRFGKLQKGSTKQTRNVSLLLRSIRFVISRFLEYLPLAITELKKRFFLGVGLSWMLLFGTPSSAKKRATPSTVPSRTIPWLEPRLKTFLNRFHGLRQNQAVTTCSHAQASENTLHYQNMATKLASSQLPQYTGNDWHIECPVSLESFGAGDKMALFCKESDKLDILKNPTVIPQGSYLFDTHVAEQIVQGTKLNPMTREPVDSYIQVILSNTNPLLSTSSRSHTVSQENNPKLHSIETRLNTLGKDLSASVDAIRFNLIPKTQRFASSLDECLAYFLTKRGSIHAASLQGLNLLDRFLMTGFTFPSLSQQFSVPHALKTQFDYLRQVPSQTHDLQQCYHDCESMLDIGGWAAQLDQAQNDLEKSLGFSNEQDKKISSILADLIALHYQLQEIERFMDSYRHEYLRLITDFIKLKNPSLISHASFLEGIIHILRLRYEHTKYSQEMAQKQE